MATVLSFAMFVAGLSYLSAVDSFRNEINTQISSKQDYYAAHAGIVIGDTDIRKGYGGMGFNSNWIDYYGLVDYRYGIEPGGFSIFGFEITRGYTVTGEGKGSYFGWDGETRHTLRKTRDVSTYADYLYISNKERDPVRLEPIFFWTPDTLDGRVHSNDTLHISGSPRFMKRVTSSAPTTDPPQSYATFDEGLGLNATPIFFPDQADSIRFYSAFSDWGTSSQDSATEITFSGQTIYRRYCGYDANNEFRCTPSTISDPGTYQVQIPTSGAIFVRGKVIVKADRNHPDIMDPSFISLGFEGRLTLASSDTMIIPDNLVYRWANFDYSVPMSISDVLGLISENYIMFGQDVDNYLYVNAAMASLNGSITVQDIYNYGQYNEKQSLYIYGSLAQRNRGLVHSSYGGGQRGFIEKDYHYDFRLQTNPPPHFLPTNANPSVYYEAFYDEG